MIEARAHNATGIYSISGHDGELVYCPVVDGKEINFISETPEMALIVGLALKYEGRNSQFPKFAARMLGIKSVWAELDED